ncbi:metal ABC transporter ATP-binding protein [Actinomyces haliotis]|uniref:metal ABC transporter ATP-binding protein n=1 Tax=Actinomyces haliotis TaxID=1280843 RepID=UPI00188F6EF0|nr:metal ABC transporter ATP-binding protein [Actinomyces haliotis]
MTPTSPATSGEQTTPSGDHRAASSPRPVSVDDVSVVLGSSLILHGVDLDVDAAESVALLGANGSGKSTLVKTVLGLIEPAAGTVRLFGHPTTQRSRVPWQRVGYVPQRVGAGSGVPATALEVVRSGLLGPRRPFADRGRHARARALAALDAVGLADRADDHVQVFSGGQAQRVLIARALVRDPELLVLDEPLAGIDRASREALASILTGLRAQGLTLLTVLHEMGELADVVERAVVLDEGRVVSDGPVADVAPDHHDHSRHDSLGHDHLDDCEHEHPHGDTGPAVHHAPVLSTSLPDQDGRTPGGTR